MFDYFNEAIARAKGRTMDSSFIYIKNTVIKNHNSVRRYVLTSSMAVPPNHLIPKIIIGLGLTSGMAGVEVINNAKDRINEVSNSLRLSSYTSFGKPFYNTLLDGGAEYILLTNDDFDLSVPWENLAPIQFMYHTYTNVDYSLGADNDDSGIGIYTINLPMLAYQFYKWGEWIRRQDAESVENVYQFCLKYPIFNSLSSYMDISQFNRIYYRVCEKYIPKDKPFGPAVPTANIIPQLDRSDNNIISFLTNKSMTIGQSLYTVPVFFEDSALDLVNKIDLYKSRQTEWFEMLYQLPFLHFGLIITKLSGKTLDRGLISKLIYELKAFINTRGLETLPKQQSLHIIENFFDPLMKLAEELK